MKSAIFFCLAFAAVSAQAAASAIGAELGRRTLPKAARMSSFRAAFKAGAEEIIVAHNHPSGDPTPSEADCDTTVRLNDGANLVGLELIDHIIVGSQNSANGTGFVSMAEVMAE